MSERGESLLVRERETEAVEIILLFWDFLSGADSISKKVVGFSPLWFPQGKFFVSLVSYVVLVFYYYACYSLS